MFHLCEWRVVHWVLYCSWPPPPPQCHRAEVAIMSPHSGRWHNQDFPEKCAPKMGAEQFRFCHCRCRQLFTVDNNPPWQGRSNLQDHWQGYPREHRSDSRGPICKLGWGGVNLQFGWERHLTRCHTNAENVWMDSHAPWHHQPWGENG